jgi:hypothetical protein
MESMMESQRNKKTNNAIKLSNLYMRLQGTCTVCFLQGTGVTKGSSSSS